MAFSAAERWILRDHRLSPADLRTDRGARKNRVARLRSLHAALSIDAAPTPNGEEARKSLIAALAKMR